MKLWRVLLIISILISAALAQNNTGASAYYREDNFLLYLIYGIVIFVSIVVIGLLIKMFYKPSETKGIIEQYKDELDEEEEKEYEKPPEKTKEEEEYEISKEDFRKMWGGDNKEV